MDFFGQQDVARARSGRYLALFALAVAAVVGAVYGVVILAEVWAARQSHGGIAAPALWQPKLFFATALGSLLVIAYGWSKESRRLDAGGGAVALALGGRQILHGRADAIEARLLHVVEEIAIAAGHPMPHVFVLDEEPGINAFAAGWTPEDAAITVTRGALELLDRDELQGVIGHEMSHLLEGDTRLNMRLMAWLAGIQSLGTLGLVLLRLGLRGSGRHRSRNDAPWPLAALGAALWLVGSLGLLAGRLLRAAVAREREHLADASAVQFTRNRAGLARALQKIGGWQHGSSVQDPQAAAMSHLFLGAPEMLGFWSRLFASHPPLIERIRRLDPAFDGSFPAVEPSQQALLREREREQAAAAAASAAKSRQQVAASPVVVGLVERAAGAPLQQARATIEALPAALRQATETPFGAAALTLALLVDRDEAVRVRQIEGLRGVVGGGPGGSALIAEVLHLAHATIALPEEGRLPLCELAAPALGDLSPAQGEALARGVTLLADADGERSIFELALERVVVRRLAGRALAPQRSGPAVGKRALAAAMADVLGAISHVGAHGDSEAARSAFDAGRSALPPLWRREINLPEASALTHARVDAALDHLAAAPAHLRREIVDAAVRAAHDDAMLTVHEAEFLRGVAEALGVALAQSSTGGAARDGAEAR